MRLDEVDDTNDNHEILKLQLRCINLINTDGYGVFKKSDPFFELHRYRYQTKRHMNFGDAVYRSKVVNNNLSPIWPSGEIPVNELVSIPSSENDTTIQFIYDSDDKHDCVYMGEVSKISIHDLIHNVNETALSDIEKIDLERSFPLYDNDNKKEVGKLLILSAEIITTKNNE